MMFESTHIIGKGRGKPMGFPTINLKIPTDINLEDGVYAAKVAIENNHFIGALHFGPIPTFGDAQKNLEVYLIDVPDDPSIYDLLENLGDKKIKVETVKFLRKVIKFRSVASLIKQIGQDVEDIKKTFSNTF